MLLFFDTPTREKNACWENHSASPLSELLEDDAVGEALPADTDPLQHPVAPELVQDQVGVQFTSLRKGNI